MAARELLLTLSTPVFLASQDFHLASASEVSMSTVPAPALTGCIVVSDPTVKVTLSSVPTGGKSAMISPVPSSQPLSLSLLGSALFWMEEADSSLDSEVVSYVS